MRLVSGIKSFLVLAIIAAMTAIVLVGLNIPKSDYSIPRAYEGIRYGIDISGGVSAVLTAPDGIVPTDDELDTVKGIIDTRLEGKQIYDKTVTVDKVNKRVLVEIPYKKGSEYGNPYDTIADIGATAMMSFREVDEDKFDPETGAYEMTDRIVLQGKDIVDAVAETNPETQLANVRLIFSDEGAKKFEEATERLVGQKIAIYLDDQMISAPIVNEKISGKDRAVITLGTSSQEESIIQAKELAAIIRSGALPFKLEAKDVNHISPIIGENALNISIYAGAVAILLVWLFMFLYYRVPGLVADITLLGQIAAIILVLVLSGMSLTLPGIAGLILTVGMSVDANVIIFERIKEEIRSGKTVNAAVDLGFKRAITAILDGNLTTLITAGVLYYFGTGAIRSFAITLGLGIIVNFITAIFATKIALTALSEIRVLRKPWLFGAKGGTANV
ncbi:protein translocase subunit SecD [Acetivibrio straminisolvens]|jgi:preprotein translocase subunit SecD|uniref:protein translocase subunit SecD n=1 Tax=Acetivibrio straminisolvens TaxID=253314 RepID=UPI002240C7CE|nr:protein translocase subunit SecD [Acetivibrio straminisolvens]